MLLLRRKHQVPVTLRLGGERCKDPAANAEIGRAHMRTLLSPFEAQRDAAKVLNCQPQSSYSRVRRRINSSCCGYALRREERSANSKSLKSNPGATVQPTSANVSGPTRQEPNQQPLGTTAWSSSPAWGLCPNLISLDRPSA